MGAEFFVDGRPTDAPISVEEVFRLRALASPMLRVRVGDMLLVFHFFSECEIECDLDPREVNGQADLDALLGFVREIGDLTGKKAIVTPENGSDVPFIEYDPGTRVMRRLTKTN
jgi:hypothetical protein